VSQTMTPREIISELDRYIVGQDDAKRAVAIALRNRWRRQQVASPMREEITPKNILMIGPTGVGKTEIARRLARLANAPFIKIEATKFTEVGYVGRDVETIIRDLVDTAIKIVREEHLARVQTKAEKVAEDKLLDILIPHPVAPNGPHNSDASAASNESREKMRQKLRLGELDKRQVEIDVEPQQHMPVMQMFTGQGTDAMDLQDMLGNMMGKQKSNKRMNVSDALKTIQQQEADRMLDQEAVKDEAIKRTENDGIVFLDEMEGQVRVEPGHHQAGGAGGEGGEGVAGRVEQVHPRQAIGDNLHDGKREVDDPEDACGFFDAWADALLFRAGGFDLEEFFAAHAHDRQHRDKQHDDAQPAEPVGKRAPEQDALGQRFDVVGCCAEDGGPGGGQPGHRLEVAVDVAGKRVGRGQGDRRGFAGDHDHGVGRGRAVEHRPSVERDGGERSADDPAHRHQQQSVTPI